VRNKKRILMSDNYEQENASNTDYSMVCNGNCYNCLWADFIITEGKITGIICRKPWSKQLYYQTYYILKEAN